jgi:hypothetical protein
MGMGNAYSATIRSCEAIYYNPAALGRLRRKVASEILNPMFDANVNSIGLITKANKVLKDNSETIDYVRDYVGEPIYANVSIAPSLCYRGVGFSVFEIAEFDATLSDKANPNMDIYVRNDYGFAMGGAYRMFNGRVKIGVAMKYIVRSEIDKNVTAQEFASNDFNLQEAYSGEAISMDTSLLLTIPITMLPRISIVSENTGDTFFTKRDSSYLGNTVLGAPAPMRQRYHFGFGISPKLSARTRLNLNFEMRDALKSTNNVYRLLHFGGELVFPRLVIVRIGFNQGYFSYGASFDFKLTTIEFAGYTQELGTYAGQKGDNRYMLKIGMGF